MTDDDDDLGARVRELWLLADPPPAGLVDAMVALVVSADLDDDLELLVLVRDSADEPAARVRGLASSRVLYFRAFEGWVMDVEIDGHVVRGQLLDHVGDPAEVTVSIESMSGDRWACALDDLGFFTVEVRVTDSVRFVVVQGTSTSASRWIEM